MKNSSLLIGFHAITARLHANPGSITHIYHAVSRHDKRMQDFLTLATMHNIALYPVEEKRLSGLTGDTMNTLNKIGTINSSRQWQNHQGVIAKCTVNNLEFKAQFTQTIEDILDKIVGAPLLLALDGITDPHNLGACLRAANGAGVHAVLAPKDRAVGITTTVAKVASGAVESTPYIAVTNLARSLRSLKDAGIYVIGTNADAPKSIYEISLDKPLALVMGSESGLRRLTCETCDILVNVPMYGSVNSLNVAVATGICLYEAQRQRIQNVSRAVLN